MKHLILFVFVLTSFSCSKKLSEAELSNKRVDRLHRYLQGNYTNKTQVKNEKDIQEYELHIAPIWEDREDEHWLYVERRNINEPNIPVHQRVVKIFENMDFIKQQVFFIPSAKDYLDGWRQVEVFDSLKPEQLLKQRGCTVFFKETEKDNFKGITLGKSCANRFKGAKYSRTDMNVKEEEMRWLEQGFDENNMFIWGPEHGGIQFVKERGD